MSSLNKKTLNKTAAKLAALALGVAGLSVQNAHAVDLLVGGHISIINSVQPINNLTLDLTSDATDFTVANFVVNNNTPGGFEIDVDLANGGRFSRDAGVSGVDWTAWDLVVDGANTGTLGTGAVAPAEDWALTLDPGNGPVTENYASGAQTTATTNYNIAMTASWTGANPVAGIYTETVTVVLTAVL
jgi:hypothetical protein